MVTSRWRVVHSSVAGASHIEAGVPCQDASACQIVDVPGRSPVLIAVVSDGAGTGLYAATGSNIACNAFIAAVSDYLMAGQAVGDIDRAKAETWIERAATEIGSCAKHSDHMIGDYSCTLLAAIIGEDAAAFLQVGDGAIVTSHGKEDGWAWVFWPQKGQFANETNFVVGDNALTTLDFDVALRRVDEVALFTDGLEGLVLHYPTRAVHDPFFENVFRPVRASLADGFDGELSAALDGFLSSQAVCERTDDDKTLVLASRGLTHESSHGGA